MTDPQAFVSYIELPAVSLADTKAFSTDAFGWTWVDYGPTYAAFEGAGIEGGLSAEASVAAMEGKVSAAGGEIVSGPYDYPGGRRFHFRDPSGNILGVYQSRS